MHDALASRLGLGWTETTFVLELFKTTRQLTYSQTRAVNARGHMPRPATSNRTRTGAVVPVEEGWGSAVASLNGKVLAVAISTRFLRPSFQNCLTWRVDSQRMGGQVESSPWTQQTCFRSWSHQHCLEIRDLLTTINPCVTYVHCQIEV